MTWLKARAALICLGSIWGALMLLFSLFHIAAYFHDRHYNLDFRDGWQYSLLLIEDILTNVFIGGYFRTTLSSELGNLQLEGSEVGTEAALMVNWGFNKATGEEDHCINAIEPNDKHWFKPWKAIVGVCIFHSTIGFIAWRLFA